METSTRPHPLQMAEVQDDNRGQICYFDPFKQAEEDGRQRNPKKEKEPAKDPKRRKDAAEPVHDQDIFLNELYKDEEAQRLGLNGVAPRID